MNPAPRTMVTFKSTAFNTSEPKDSFINACCFGDDLCRWLMQQLQAQGIETAGEPGQEDFGWYFTFQAGGVEHCFVVGYQPGDDDEGAWIGQIERHVGFWRSLLGGRQHGILPEATQAIHQALVSSDCIRALRWHVERGAAASHEDAGAEEP